MPDKSTEGGQPSLEKLQAEGVSPRRCISYEGLGEYQGGNGGNQGGGSKAAKPKGALASMARTGKGGY